MKKFLILIALLPSLTAQAASSNSSSHTVKMNFEKKASLSPNAKPFNLKDHQFNVRLSEQLNSNKDLANNPKASKLEEKAVKLLSIGFEF